MVKSVETECANSCYMLAEKTHEAADRLVQRCRHKLTLFNKERNNIIYCIKCRLYKGGTDDLEFALSVLKFLLTLQLCMIA